MKVDLLAAEIGSTTTIVNAFQKLNTPEPVFVGQGMSRTTVDEGDVNLGLAEALRGLEQKLGQALSWDRFAASSSAAGGLKMTVHGLVYQMTARAAKEAALGAGAVVKLITAGEITAFDLGELAALQPNLILLAGGVDYGEKETVLKNAALLARWLREKSLTIPVIYCGNRAAAGEAAGIFEAAGLALAVTDNVYPEIDRLEVQPARRLIQQLFNEHIVEARGMERVRRLVDGEIIPTPGAVMEAAQLAAEQLADLVVFDVGGATTDVYSVTGGDPEIQQLLVSPEPAAKRTVEGDLGVYRNAARVAELAGAESPGEAGGNDLLRALPPVPKTAEQEALVGVLAGRALRAALLRHAGRWRHHYGPAGRHTVVEGKDLTRVRWVIGTGGALVRLPGGEALMAAAMRGETGQELLPKGGVRFLLDRRYIMASTGLLARQYPAAAWTLLKESLGI